MLFYGPLGYIESIYTPNVTLGTRRNNPGTGLYVSTDYYIKPEIANEREWLLNLFLPVQHVKHSGNYWCENKYSIYKGRLSSKEKNLVNVIGIF